jgi:regulator of protease activity HflC (stomatin/prohibitin superfamily)
MSEKRGFKINPALAGFALIIIVSFVLLSSGLIWFTMSFETVDVTEYGLKQHSIDRWIDETQIYEAGRHDVGIWFDMIRFPATVQVVEYFSPEPGEIRTSSESPLGSRSNDGLLISIEVAFHYKLRKNQLLNLYKEFANTYHDRYIGEGRTSLRDAASFFNAIEFFNNRTGVQIVMEEILTESLNEMYADVVFLQLRDVNLPDEFEDALRRVQVAQQEFEIALFEQDAAIVRAQTRTLEAQAQANITVLTAEANAEAFGINMKAQADALNITLNTQSLAYYGMGQQLNLTSTELLSLLWILAIMEHDESLLIIGENTPILTIPVNGTGS